MSEQSRLQINWVSSAGGALGAVSSAVVLSSLGAAGTLLGAALGSLCITVGGAIYSHYLEVTKERVAAQALAARRSGRVRESVPAGSSAQGEDPPRSKETDPDDRAERRAFASRVLHGLPWKRIIAISAALFALSMAVIVAFELSTGRAVSTYTGGTSSSDVGTSIPGWSGTGQGSSDAENDEQTPEDTPSGDVVEEDTSQDEGEVPQEGTPSEEGEVPSDEGEVPQDEGEVPQEEAPADEGEVPQEEAPAEEGEVPQQEAPQEPAPAPVPEAPAP